MILKFSATNGAKPVEGLAVLLKECCPVIRKWPPIGSASIGDDDQVVRIRVGQRADQERIGDAEYGGVRSDSKR